MLRVTGCGLRGENRTNLNSQFPVICLLTSDLCLLTAVVFFLTPDTRNLKPDTCSMPKD